MKLIAWNKTVSLCSAIVVIGGVCVATAVISFNLPHRSVINLTQVVDRTVKADRFEFPDVALTVARSEKANGRHKPVALHVVFKSELTGLDESVQMADAARKSDRTPEPVDDTAATVDGTTALSSNDDASVVVEPASNTHETSTNVTAKPEVSNSPPRSVWRYSREIMERAGRRVRFLWDTLDWW